MSDGKDQKPVLPSVERKKFWDVDGAGNHLPYLDCADLVSFNCGPSETVVKPYLNRGVIIFGDTTGRLVLDGSLGLVGVEDLVVTHYPRPKAKPENGGGR